MEPSQDKVLLIVPESYVDFEGDTLVTQDDDFGWLFEHLYLRRHGFQVTVCLDQDDDILNSIAQFSPDLVVWLSAWSDRDRVLQMLSTLQFFRHTPIVPRTFVLTTGRHPDPDIMEQANATHPMMIDQERFLAIVNQLLQRRNDPDSHVPYELPTRVTYLPEHPDPEIRAFFQRMIAKYGP